MIHKRTNWNTLKKEKATLDKLKQIDPNIIVKKNNVSYNTETKKAMYSYSRLYKGINEMNFIFIDDKKLEEAKVFGSKFMLELQEFMYGGYEVLNNKYVEKFLKWIEENDLLILNVEQIVISDEWLAYVDCIVESKISHRKYFIEIKTRNDGKLRESDIRQCWTYSAMLNGIKGIVVIINKKKNTIHPFLIQLSYGNNFSRNYLKGLELIGLPKIKGIDICIK